MSLLGGREKKISGYKKDLSSFPLSLNAGKNIKVRDKTAEIIDFCKNVKEKHRDINWREVYSMALCFNEMSSLRFGIKSKEKYLKRAMDIATDKELALVRFWGYVAFLYKTVIFGRNKDFEETLRACRRESKELGSSYSYEIIEKEILNSLNTGDTQAYLNKLKELSSAYKDDNELFPSSRLNFLRGLVYKQAGDKDKAKDCLCKSLEQQDEAYEWYIGALLAMADLLLNEGNIREAHQNISEAQKLLAQTQLEDSFYHCELENIRSKILAGQNKYDEAEECLFKSIEYACKQDNPLKEGCSRLLLGELYFKKEEYEKANMSLEEAGAKFVIINNEHLLNKTQKLRKEIAEKFSGKKEKDSSINSSLASSVNTFMKSMIPVMDIKILLNKSIDFIMQITQADRGYLILVDREGNLHSEVVRKKNKVAQLESGFKSYSRTFVKEVLKTGKSINVSDTQGDDRFAYAMSVLSMEIRSVVCVPMKEGNRIRGLIYFDKKEIDAFSRDDVNFVETIAEYISLALKNARMHIKTRRELENTQQQLTQAEKLSSIGTLASGIAHEINNPMGAILTSVQNLLKDIEDEDKAESLQIIQQAARKCRGITKKLLSYARVSDEGPKHEISINDAIEDALMLLHPQANKFKIKIKKELNSSAQMMGSLNQLQQVFTNLGLNAIDAIRESEQGGEIVFKSYDKDDSVVAEVIDEGKGIPSVNITRLFDPFFSTKDVQEGTGLGLSVSYGIIKRHGGEIEVQSETGKGSVFKVKLPKLS
ncbi:MAG: ATP-binding protein [Elusimicrobiota bacterium]